MVSSKHGARITESDVRDLDDASTCVANAAATIQRANPTYAEAVVQLLITANNTICRLRDKGGSAFARYLQKHGTGKPQDASEIAPVEGDADQALKSRPEEEEA